MKPRKLPELLKAGGAFLLGETTPFRQNIFLLAKRVLPFKDVATRKNQRKNHISQSAGWRYIKRIKKATALHTYMFGTKLNA